MLEHEIEYVKMAETESKLWWYQNLHQLVIDKIVKLSRGNREVRILDAACGTGGLMLKLKVLGYNNVQGFDLSEHAISFCKGKNLKVERLNLKDVLELKNGPKFDIIVCNDALYFLSFEEKQKFLADINTIIAPNGYFMANEPALNMFRGTHDQCVGVATRVDKDMVHKTVAGSAFKILRITFWPFFLFPVIYLVRLKQRLMIKRGYFKNAEMVSDVSMPNPIINWVLFFITRLENIILPSKPLGSSLFWIAQHKDK
ncbi:MAG TPA: class I SAM-dependent methyltransferase [Bacteriovoracaceae bacterium]|nr:class I SAM-dependent methyltransferase [Bacteriovoracaceae bacterium]